MQLEVLETMTKTTTSSATIYKEQSLVERRFRAVKHPPLQVRPLWLHQPRRIASLVFVVMVALFLFALIEREAHCVVQQSGRVFTGLRAEGRDRLPVTATHLVEAFAPLTLVKQHLRNGSEIITLLVPTTLSPPQPLILERLGLMAPDHYLHPMVTQHPIYRVWKMSLAYHFCAITCPRGCTWVDGCRVGR